MQEITLKILQKTGQKEFTKKFNTTSKKRFNIYNTQAYTGRRPIRRYTMLARW